MAEEKKASYTPAKAVTAVKKDDTKAGFFKRVGKWFREMRSELKKVVWPNKKHVAKDTGIVLLCSLVVGACIWIFDYVSVQAVQAIIGLFN